MPVFKSHLGPREYSKSQIRPYEEPVPDGDGFKIN